MCLSYAGKGREGIRHIFTSFKRKNHLFNGTSEQNKLQSKRFTVSFSSPSGHTSLKLNSFNIPEVFKDKGLEVVTSHN